MDPEQASLEPFKDNLFAPLVSLEGLLILTLMVLPVFKVVALRLRHVKQLDDFLLQVSHPKPTLRGGVFFFLLEVLDFAILHIGVVQLFFRQFLVPASAKAVDRVDAGVIYRRSERLFGDLV